MQIGDQSVNECGQSASDQKCFSREFELDTADSSESPELGAFALGK